VIFKGVMVSVETERSVLVKGDIGVYLSFRSAEGVDGELVAVEVLANHTFFSDSIKDASSATATK